MKKLFYSIVLFLSICSFTYAEINSTPSSVINGILQDKEYKKITPDQVQKDAILNIKAKYGDYQITEAAVAADGEYKLVLKKDNAIISALFTSVGDLIKIL